MTGAAAVSGQPLTRTVAWMPDAGQAAGHAPSAAHLGHARLRLLLQLRLPQRQQRRQLASSSAHLHPGTPGRSHGSRPDSRFPGAGALSGSGSGGDSSDALPWRTSRANLRHPPARGRDKRPRNLPGSRELLSAGLVHHETYGGTRSKKREPFNPGCLLGWPAACPAGQYRSPIRRTTLVVNEQSRRTRRQLDRTP